MDKWNKKSWIIYSYSDLEVKDCVVHNIKNSQLERNWWKRREGEFFPLYPISVLSKCKRTEIG